MVFAQAPALDYSGLVKCDGVLKPGEPGRREVCNFAALFDTINKTINWMFYISIPVATALFAYAGLLYMRGTSGSRTQANTIFTNVGIGFIIMLTAWFLVRQVVGWFVKSEAGATIFLETKTSVKK
jgi:hypothetical protein